MAYGIIRNLGSAKVETKKYLFKSGVQKVTWDNSGYRINSNYTCDGGFTINSTSFVCPSISSNSHNRSILTQDKVAFDGYAKLVCIYNTTEKVELDISSVTEGYVVLSGVKNGSGTTSIGIIVSSAKTYYATNILVVKDVIIGLPVTLNEVYLEK